MTVKMPEPMTAPMPSAVSDHGPRVFFSAVLGFFRVPDQLVDRLAGKQLAGQGSSPHPSGCGMLSIAGFRRVAGLSPVQHAFAAVYRMRTPLETRNLRVRAPASRLQNGCTGRKPIGIPRGRRAPALPVRAAGTLLVVGAVALPLGHAASQLLHLLLLLAARLRCASPWGLPSCGRRASASCVPACLQSWWYLPRVTSFAAISSGFPAHRVDVTL